MGMFRNTHFVLQKVQIHKTSVLVYKKLARNCVEQWMFDNSELAYNLPRVVKGDTFQTGQKVARFLAVYWRKKWKIWKIMLVPKLEILQKTMKKS